MTRITVLGGTGYAGSAITGEAARRGHEVTVFSRSAPTAVGNGITSVTGSALERGDLERAIDGAEVVVVALAPNGNLEGNFERVNAEIAEIARKSGARLGVIGGAGTLHTVPGGPKVYETEGFPEQFRGFSVAADAVLTALEDSDEDLDWFVLSPPRGFGHYAPGEALGRYRVGRDVVLADSEGRSEISGADFATAFVDEIERPVHRRKRFTVAY